MKDQITLKTMAAVLFGFAVILLVNYLANLII
jgi:hypothetical protein